MYEEGEEKTKECRSKEVRERGEGGTRRRVMDKKEAG